VWRFYIIGLQLRVLRPVEKNIRLKLVRMPKKIGRRKKEKKEKKKKTTGKVK
jgi:hypothetical protein